jgi:predicted methyltransferase
MHEADALVGRRVLVLGDDDLVSVTIERVVRHLGSGETVRGLGVVEVEPALREFLSDRLAGAPFPVSCVRHDLREPLPIGFRRCFDTVTTDPPYTIGAARLFLSRALEALAGPAGDVFLSFGSKRPGATFELQRAIAEAGLVIQRLVPDFNEYLGAGVLAGSSHLYHLRASSATRPLVEGSFDGALYTGAVPLA